MRVAVIHGPNLNLLGTREPHLYGTETLAEINRRLVVAGRAAGRRVKCVQSNYEGRLVDEVQRAKTAAVAFIILNPGAYTHTSIAMRDALLAVNVPFIEIHLSNVFAREEFRHTSYFSDIARGCIFGLGAQGYELALLAASRCLSGGK